jgi:YVTN family beta-propeller protein
MSSRIVLLKSDTKLCRRAHALAVGILLLVCLSCGETYRPVANPIIPPQPNPAFTHVVMVITDNGANNPGASTTIDVSGDTASSQSQAGLGPVFATLVGGTQVYVANSLEDTVSEFSAAGPAPVVTISVGSSCGSPPCSMPVFLGTTETATVYLANSKSNTVSAIATATNVITNQIAVGTSPVALAETPDTQKVYVANQGSNGSGGSVSVINTLDKTLVGNPPLASFGWVSPVWVLARSDSQRTYVLDEGSGLVAAIDTSSDSVVSTVSVGAGANYMIYDSTLNRIYVVNPVANTVTSLDASTDTLPATVLAIANPKSVTALADGTRFYVSSGAVAGGTLAAKVTVINAPDFTVKSTISLTPVPALPQFCTVKTWAELSVAAAADNSRVYVGNCDAGATAIIQTSNDTLLTQMPAPFSARKPVINGQPPPPQNPVFVVAGP